MKTKRTRKADGDTAQKLLGVVADLLRGDRHSRQTVAKATGRSLPTADRWIAQLTDALALKPVREGKTTWVSYEDRRVKPTKPATAGACVAASLASMFEGTEHERNLKDARDFMLRARGESYGDLDRKFVFDPRGGEAALPEQAGSLDEIIDTLMHGHELGFSYRHNDGHAETLVVQPLSLVIFEHQFYLLSRRPDEKLYCFRFARMTDVEGTGRAFSYPTKIEYDPLRVLEPVFGVHISKTGPVEDIVAILSGPWASYALTHRGHRTQDVTKRPDGRVRVSFRVRLCPEVESWALGFGEFVEIVNPPPLRDQVAARLRKALALTSRRQPSVAKAKRRAGAALPAKARTQ